MLHVNIYMFDADINKLHVNKLIMLHVDIMILPGEGRGRSMLPCDGEE